MLRKSSFRCVVHIGVLSERDMWDVYLYNTRFSIIAINPTDVHKKSTYKCVGVFLRACVRAWVRACVSEYVRQCVRTFDLVSEVIDRDVQCKDMSLRH